MVAIPDTRFVRIRLPVEDHPAATITFLAADPAFLPSADNNGILAKVADEDPGRARQIIAGLADLLKREDEIIRWIESDQKHGLAFTRDPLGSISQALPDLPGDFFTRWAKG